MRPLIVLAAVLIVSPAHALDYDDNWIKKTIRQSARQEYRHERRYYYAPQPKPRRYYAPQPKPREYYAPERHVVTEPSSGTSVISHGPSRLERDALSNVACMPATGAIGGDFYSAGNAREDAERHWELEVSWRYGERFADVRNAERATRKDICGLTRSADSMLGRVTEVFRGKPTRCEIIARPCMASEVRN